MWFKVDDSFHSHPKATAVSLEALGLWTVSGSWSGDHLTDGFVPDHMVSMLSRGQAQLAEELINAGLWRRAKGGYRFHQWNERNPTRSVAIAAAEKKASGGVLGNHLRWHTKAGKQKADCPFCQEKQASHKGSVKRSGSDRSSESGPNPDPTRPEESSTNSLTGDQDHRFSEFWTVYPRKKAKDAARKAYAAAIKRGADPQDVLDGIAAYRDECERERREDRFIAHATTWLNQGRWKDHLEPAEPVKRRSIWDN
jgi:hypothetical protein